MDVFLNVRGYRVCVSLSEESGKRVVLFCHGFPGSNRLAKLARALEDRNTALAELHYRGDPKSGGLFSFEGMIEDIIAAVQMLTQRFEVIVGLGYSTGGYAMMHAVRRCRFAKIVLLNPVLSIAFFRDDPIAPKLWRSAQLTLKLQDQEGYRHEIAALLEKEQEAFAHVPEQTVIVKMRGDEVLPFQLAEKFAMERHMPFVPVEGNHDACGSEPELIQALMR